MSFSNYYISLNEDMKKRYGSKLEIIDNIDPYNIQVSELSQDLSFLPEVWKVDLFKYLICTHNFCTERQLKQLFQNYKSEAAVVQDALGKKINQDAFVVVAKVKHSQEVIEMLNVWIVILKEGDISRAHCTCMSDLDEVCNHVVSVLLYLFSNSVGNSACKEGCDSCSVPPSDNVKVRDMYWGEPRTVTQQTTVKPISDEELHAMIRSFIDEGHIPAIALVMEPFASEIAEKNKIKNSPH